VYKLHYQEMYFIFLFTMARQPLVGGPRPLNCRGFQKTFRHITIGRTPLDGGTLLGNTQHSQLTIIHATGGIRTHNPSKWAVADSCGHRVRLFIP